MRANRDLTLLVLFWATSISPLPRGVPVGNRLATRWRTVPQAAYAVTGIGWFVHRALKRPFHH